MAKELRIPVTIELPEGIFEQGAVLHQIQPALATFIEAIKKITTNFSADAEIVTPRDTKAKDPAAGQGSLVEPLRGHSAEQDALPKKHAA